MSASSHVLLCKSNGGGATSVEQPRRLRATMGDGGRCRGRDHEIHQGNELHETWVVGIGPRAARHFEALRAGAIPTMERHVSDRDTDGASCRRARRPARAVPVGDVRALSNAAMPAHPARTIVSGAMLSPSSPKKHRPNSQRGGGATQRCLHLGRRLDSLSGGHFLFDVHPGLAPIFGCVGLLNFLHRNEPGSHAMQDCRQPFGSIASRKIGVVHGHDHGAFDAQEAEKKW